MTTGQNIHDLLPFDEATYKTAVNTLRALNAAVYQSWPQIRLTEYSPSAATLDRDTYTYALAAGIGLRDLGVGRVFIAENTDESEVSHRNLRQYWDESAAVWTLVFPSDVVDEFHGKVVNVAYQYKHAALNTIDDTINLPESYLMNYCGYWYAQHFLTEQNSDLGAIRDLLVLYRDEWQAALRANQSPQMMLPWMTGGDRMG